MHKDAVFFEGLLAREGCSRKVIAHCRTVTAIAMEYVHEDSLADPDLVLAGSVLHDIGRSRTHSIGHAQAGAAICRGLGQPESVARIVECHTGAGLTADECTLLGLLPIDCMPATLEERIITNADNLAAGKRRISIEQDLMDAFALPRKIRKRMYRLWLEMEQFRT